MDMGLSGKTAIVTAASKGLGRASAFSLAREGANVTICARGRAALEEATREIEKGGTGRVHSVIADLNNLSDINRVIEETVQCFGGIDILVTNAGGPALGPFGKITDEEWQDAFQVNVLGVVRLIRLVIPHMRRRGGGRIINITTVGVLKPQPNLTLSDASRHAVVGLALNLALELAPDNILVNTLCPGPIRSERMDQAIRATAAQEGKSLAEAEEHWLNLVPLHRFGTPSDFGDLLAYLASARASFITGAIIPVDGGKSIS